MRVQKASKNISFAVIAKIVALILSFISRTVFINTLGVNYLGINGLFTNILTILNLSELGIGGAIVFSLYKPLAINDTKKVQALLKLYRKLYFFIGLSVLCIGTMAMPLLPYIIKGESNLTNLKFIYCLYLIRSISTYWFFAYKTVIISADQKSHITNKINIIYSSISTTIQIVLLLVFENFIVYNVFYIFSNICQNFVLRRKAEKLYPFIRERNSEKLSKDEITRIFKNVVGISMYKISSVVLSATDNIVISAFVGISFVGLYSNYTILVSSVSSIAAIIFGSLTPSIGNMNISENKEKKENNFKCISFLNFWVYGFCAICFFVLLNPFIQLWIGKSYLLSFAVVIAIYVNFTISGLQIAVVLYKDACGLFWIGKFRPIASAIINLGVSIVLAQYLGIVGVLLGTVISRVLTTAWFDPWMVHKHVFNKSPKKYYIDFIKKFLLISIIAMCLLKITQLFGAVNWFTFICSGLLCLFIPNIIFFLLYKKTKEFRYLYNIADKLFIKKAKKILLRR